MAMAYGNEALCVSDWYLTLLQAVAEAVEGVGGEGGGAECFITLRQSEKRPQSLSYIDSVDAETIELALAAHGNTEREDGDE